MRHNKPHNLVLALGNWYQQDDAIALVLYQRLKSRFNGTVAWLATEEAGLTLLEYLVGYRRVILVDAIVTTAPEGTVVPLRLDDFRVHAAAAWHQMGIPEVILMGKELRLPMPREVVLLGIAVRHCNWGTDGICATLKRQLPQIQQQVLSQVKRLIS